jgi:hypothetical protein
MPTPRAVDPRGLFRWLPHGIPISSQTGIRSASVSECFPSAAQATASEINVNARVHPDSTVLLIQLRACGSPNEDKGECEIRRLRGWQPTAELSAQRSATYLLRSEKSFFPPRTSFVAESARFVLTLRFDSHHWTNGESPSG